MFAVDVKMLTTDIYSGFQVYVSSCKMVELQAPSSVVDACYFSVFLT